MKKNIMVSIRSLKRPFPPYVPKFKDDKSDNLLQLALRLLFLHANEAACCKIVIMKWLHDGSFYYYYTLIIHEVPSAKTNLQSYKRNIHLPSHLPRGHV